MKKCFVIVLLILSAFTTYCQIKFEKGYFIDNEGTKVECLIKNVGWKLNPTDIEYKSDENSESKTLTASAIQEFSIYNSSKYVARTVNIDTSPSQLSSLTSTSNPIFKEERLFLKVLLEGKANLYYYENADAFRLLYTIGESPVEQLIFKEYMKSTGEIGQNNRFRQQLWTALDCSSIDKNRFKNLHYTKKAMMKIFSDYNTCSGTQSTTFEDKTERELFAVTLRPRLNYSSLAAQNYTDKSSHFDWGSDMIFGFGIEGELFMPFNKNKWSLILEPTYQHYKASTTGPDYSNLGSEIIADISYTSVEISLGIRHYFFLNDHSRIFANGTFIMDFATSSSEINITRGYHHFLFELSGSPGFTFGAGFQHKKFSIEARYYSIRNPLNDFISWSASYKTFSVIAGYSIFRKRS